MPHKYINSAIFESISNIVATDLGDKYHANNQYAIP